MTAARLEDLVRRQARRSPATLAVRGPDGELDYAGLDAEADRVAGALAALGIGPGHRVALWLPKGVRAVAAMQGVLRTGAAYVPVDPAAPDRRAAVIIGDAAPGAVITTEDKAERVPGGIAVLTAWPQVRPYRQVATGPDDLAYILYTSGSTGAPKGVCVSHRNALAFVEWAAAELSAGPGDRFANHAPFHFDLSVLDIYAAFLAGASVYLIPQEWAYRPGALVDFLVEAEITVWYSVPSALILMARDGGLLGRSPAALRALLFAGEPYPVAHLRPLREHLPGVRFLNLYGPTETNVCTFHEVREVGPEPVPIGVACSGDKVWAARPDGSPTRPGEEGELIVDGPTVMLGYWGAEPQAGRPYRTGDMVVLRDGVYHYAGRRDGMVKLRGNRVELGEVEAVLHTCPGVEDAVTVVVGSGLEARLVAFLVAPERPGLLAVKRHCAAALPRHMIVDEVRYLAELPRTGNGKTDRRALAAAAERTS